MQLLLAEIICLFLGPLNGIWNEKQIMELKIICMMEYSNRFENNSANNSLLESVGSVFERSLTVNWLSITVFSFMRKIEN